MRSFFVTLVVVLSWRAVAVAAWLTIDRSVEIAAPSAIVWNVVTDGAAYPQWNPFVRACRSTWQPHDDVVMQVRLWSWLPEKSQTEVVIENDGERHLCYGYEVWPGALSSRRCHDLDVIAPDRTRYRSSFALSGWLAPVVRLLLGGALRDGFDGMTTALQQRAEQLARPASSSAR